MSLAKVSANGQITIPAEIRKQLDIQEDDKVFFVLNESGSVIFGNASKKALQNVQMAFANVAEELGNPSEEDIQSWVNEVRYGAATHA